MWKGKRGGKGETGRRVEGAYVIVSAATSATDKN